jgi:hypothetical protein
VAACEAVTAADPVLLPTDELGVFVVGVGEDSCFVGVGSTDGVVLVDGVGEDDGEVEAEGDVDVGGEDDEVLGFGEPPVPGLVDELGLGLAGGLEVALVPGVGDLVGVTGSSGSGLPRSGVSVSPSIEP